jgi:hypothetical protein
MGVSLYLHKEKLDRSVREVTGYKVDNQNLVTSRDREFFFLCHMSRLAVEATQLPFL